MRTKNWNCKRQQYLSELTSNNRAKPNSQFYTGLVTEAVATNTNRAIKTFFSQNYLQLTSQVLQPGLTFHSAAVGWSGDRPLS